MRGGGNCNTLLNTVFRDTSIERDGASCLFNLAPLAARRAGRGRRRPLQHRKTARLGSARKRLVECGDLGTLSFKFPAPALSAACSALDAFGIAITDGARVRNASATWRAVALCASA